MAPEIIMTALGQSDSYDFSVDWWSLGKYFIFVKDLKKKCISFLQILIKK